MTYPIQSILHSSMGRQTSTVLSHESPPPPLLFLPLLLTCMASSILPNLQLAFGKNILLLLSQVLATQQFPDINPQLFSLLNLQSLNPWRSQLSKPSSCYGFVWLCLRYMQSASNTVVWDSSKPYFSVHFLAQMFIDENSWENLKKTLDLLCCLKLISCRRML